MPGDAPIDPLEALSARTGEALTRLRDWQARELIRGTTDEAVADAERVRLIRLLLARGIELDLIAEADAQQGGLLDRFVASSYAWSQPPEHTFSELIRRARDPDVARRLWHAAGMSEHDDGVGDDDLDALALLTTAIDAGLPEDALLQLVHVYADALRRVAEAEVRLVHYYIHERFRAQGLTPSELIEAMQAVGDQLLAAVEPTVLYFHRKGWVSANRDDLALHVLEAAEDAAPPAVPGQLTAAIVFADLARFTPLTEAMGDAAAAEVMQRFSDVVRTATTAHRGRVVKQIGDAFMLVFFEPRAALTCALEIDARASDESHFPAVRSGAHWGEALYREGDYLGTTVNIAARLGSEAGPHEILVTSALADAAGSLPDCQTIPIGRRPLKGVGDAIELCVIRRAAAEPGERLVDPVCGMEIPAAHAAARLEVAGVLQGFCSNECLQRFVEAPERYRV